MDNSKSGFPVLAVLGIVFVTLKLTGVIAWSWLWVTAPFWGPFALVIVLLLIAGLFYGVGKALSKVAPKPEPTNHQRGLRPVGK